MVKTTYTLRFAVLLTAANGFIDAHTYISRGGVFANVQTANVIFGAIEVSNGHWGHALGHLWPILAFFTGVLTSAQIKSEQSPKLLRHPLRWIMGLQAAALAAFGFVPASVPHSFVTVPISYLAGIQMSLFRNIGDLPYMPVATTGNLMRFIEAGYIGFVDRQATSRKAFDIYGILTIVFAAGAVVGAFTSIEWGVHAIWIPAAVLAFTLVLFVIDQHKNVEP